MDKADVISSIEESFKNVKYPGDNNIAIKRQHAGGDQLKISNRLKGRTWYQLTEDDLLFLYDSLSLITMEALLYYIPAFLIFSLDIEAADMTFVGTILMLSPPPSGVNSPEKFNDMASVFSTEQCCSILFFFKLLHEKYSDDLSGYIQYEAVVEYWENRCNAI